MVARELVVEDTKEDVERAAAAGFDAYIAKPIDIHALAEQIAGFLHGALDG